MITSWSPLVATLCTALALTVPDWFSPVADHLCAALLGQPQPYPIVGPAPDMPQASYVREYIETPFGRAIRLRETGDISCVLDVQKVGPNDIAIRFRYRASKLGYVRVSRSADPNVTWTRSDLTFSWALSWRPEDELDGNSHVDAEPIRPHIWIPLRSRTDCKTTELSCPGLADASTTRMDSVWLPPQALVTELGYWIIADISYALDPEYHPSPMETKLLRVPTRIVAQRRYCRSAIRLDVSEFEF